MADWPPRCAKCLTVLTEPGAVILTPPLTNVGDTTVDEVVKLHIGTRCGCWGKVDRFINE